MRENEITRWVKKADFKERNEKRQSRVQANRKRGTHPHHFRNMKETTTRAYGRAARQWSSNHRGMGSASMLYATKWLRLQEGPWNWWTEDHCSHPERKEKPVPLIHPELKQPFLLNVCHPKNTLFACSLTAPGNIGYIQMVLSSLFGFCWKLYNTETPALKQGVTIDGVYFYDQKCTITSG